MNFVVLNVTGLFCFGEEEITQKELAEKLNISQSYISRIEKKVIKKIKETIKI